MGIFRQFPYSNFHDMNMDEIIKIVRQLADDWVAYQAKWDQLYTDVNEAFISFTNDFNSFLASCDSQFQSYMASLDPELILRTVLTDMLLDGSLSAIITTPIAEATTAWLNENITQPTSPVIDASLSVSGAGADAKVTGEMFKKVNRNIENISETTNNLFDINAIQIGRKGDGAPLSARSISAIMHVGPNGARIKALNLPANLKYDVERYNNSQYSSIAGSSAWIADDREYIYNSPQEYIALLFANTDNSAMSETDLSGLKIQVNAGNALLEYEPYLTAKDVPSRNILSAYTEDLPPYGLLPLTGWKNVTLSSGVENTTNIRITSDFIKIDPKTRFKITRKSNYQIALAYFDVNHTWIRDIAYVVNYDIYSVTAPANAEYIRIIMRKADDSTILPTDVFGCGVVLEKNNVNWQPVNAKIMTYNIGQYHYGVEPYGLNNDNYDEKLTNYRRFFGEEKCDIVCLQEYKTYINDLNTKYSMIELFGHWYKFYESVGSWEAVDSKYPIHDSGMLTLSTGRRMVYANININDIEVYVLSVHLSPGFGSDYAAIRASEVDEILSLISDKEYFIVCGDFNPDPEESDTLYSKFSNLGYNLANCGFFGKFWTWSTNRNDFHTEEPHGTVFYIDNIITSSNIDIVSVKKINTYDELSSDHIPIVAEVCIHQDHQYF